MLPFFVPKIKEINHLPDLDLFYYQKFIPTKKANRILNKLLSLNYFSDERSAIVVPGGEKKKVPRKQIWYSDAKTRYRFSGNELKENILPKWLNEIRNILNEFLVMKHIIPFDSKDELNSVLINNYRNGKDHIGWHTDKTGDLNQIQNQTIIVSLTFGVTRPFVFRRKEEHSIKYSLNLAHGDLLIIKGKTNDFWQHALPKRLNIVEPRVNLTFRIAKEKIS